MSRPAWYRSLYWRMALGLVVFLGLALAAQGLLFIWMTDRIAGSMPARSPRQLAFLVASDVSSALEREPALDLEAHLREHYGDVFRPIVVVMHDGRTAANRPAEVPASVGVQLREELIRLRSRRRPVDRGPRRGGPLVLRRRADFAPIFVDGAPVGVVAVALGPPPFSVAVRELGPTMGLVGALVLLVGGIAIAAIVFGPARRRLRHVQEATARLGAGDLNARAPEAGGDEVAQLARSFNRMAEELAARAEAVESSDRARRQLLADVSHELMTPLTAMRGYLETLSMKDVPLDSPTRERYLQIVDEETRRLENIIGDLLDLARLEGGGTALRRERVAVAGLFERVAMRHERVLETRRIALQHEVDPEARFVTGDPDRLEQVLQNLVANALRHTPDDGTIAVSAAPTPSLDSRSARPEHGRTAGGVRLTVRDSGPGIPPEHLPLIFDRFYKADASRGGVGGSGLGLSIVKAIVERHGGTINVRNDRGAVFEIWLPGGAAAS